MMSDITDSSKVNTIAELIGFLEKLRTDLSVHPEQWGNADLESFLEAMTRWVSDCNESMTDVDRQLEATWKLFAQMMIAGRSYE
jgi:hypothetical protein